MRFRTEQDRQAFENLLGKLEEYIRCRRGECVFETDCLKIVCNEYDCEEG